MYGEELYKGDDKLLTLIELQSNQPPLILFLKRFHNLSYDNKISKTEPIGLFLTTISYKVK